MLLLAAYGLRLLFSLKTHRELLASSESGEASEVTLPIEVALGTLAFVTLLVALVSEVFVASVQQAAVSFGMTPAFVGFIVVSLVGGAGEMGSAFSGARKNRLDLSVGIALGAASQIALFVAPRARAAELCPRPAANGFAVLAWRRGDDAHRHDGSSASDQQRKIDVVCRRIRADGLFGLRHDALLVTSSSTLKYHLRKCGCFT